MSGDSIPPVVDTVNRVGGLIQDPFDPRDRYYQGQDSTPRPTSVDLRRGDNAQLFSARSVYDQGPTNSCVANSVAAAFRYEEEKAGRSADTWGPAGPSRLFIYWNARGGYKNDHHDIPNVKDKGTHGREAIKGIATVGACSEADCPFVDVAGIRADLGAELEVDALEHAVERAIKKVVNAKPSDAAFRNAAPHRITSYYRLDPDRPDKDDAKLTKAQKDQIGICLLDRLRKCLTEGYPVTFGFWYYLEDKDMFDETEQEENAGDTTKQQGDMDDTTEQQGDTDDTTEQQEDTDDTTNIHYLLRDVWDRGVDSFPRHTFPRDLPPERRIKDKKGKPQTDGHSVLAIGYDDQRGPEGRQGQVLVQNSWGPKWGADGGTFWMPYAWITDFAATNDFWTIRTAGDGSSSDQAPMLWQDLHQEILASV